MKKTCFNCAYYLEPLEAEPGICGNEKSPNYDKDASQMKHNYCRFHKRWTRKHALQREILSLFCTLTDNWKLLEKAEGDLELTLERYEVK